MNSKYCFLKENDDIAKTVWSYKKQQKLINDIIKKYPNPINLKQKLSFINNSDCRILAEKIDPDWSMEEYITFIKKYIIKYSRFGKFILANLIGTTTGILGGYYLDKYLWRPKNIDSVKEIMNDKNLSSEEKHIKLNAIIDFEKQKIIQKQNPFNVKNITPYAFGIGTKSLAGYGAYKFLDSLDKKITKKNA